MYSTRNCCHYCIEFCNSYCRQKIHWNHSDSCIQRIYYPKNSAMIGPMSMFVTGMLIGGMELKKILTDKRTYFISFMRLITIPLIALLILKISGLKGWNKDGEQILLIVFMAVISPVASTVTQMCQVYDNDSRYASAINVLTTIGAIVTMPLMVFMYQIII